MKKSLEGNQGQRQVPRARCQGRRLFPFLPPPLSCRGRRKAQGTGRWLGQLCSHTPHPQVPEASQLNLLHPSSLNTPSTSGCPLAADQAGVRGSGARVTRSPLPPSYPRVGVSGAGAGSWPGGSHFPSPTAAVQVPRAEPRRRGRALWTRPRGESSLPVGRKRQSGGWCCAERGAPSRPAPGTPPGPGSGPRVPARSELPLRARPAAWPPQVRSRAPAPRPRRPAARPFSLARPSPPPPRARACSRLRFFAAVSAFFQFFPKFLARASHPNLTTFSSPTCYAILFSPCLTFPCPPSSRSPLSLHHWLSELLRVVSLVLPTLNLELGRKAA